MPKKDTDSLSFVTAKVGPVLDHVAKKLGDKRWDRVELVFEQHSYKANVTVSGSYEVLDV